MISRYMVLVASEQKLLMMRPYQIYAVKAIVDCIEQNCGNGYIWHTTGSGKTLTSFKASTLLKDNPDIDKCLFVVDRKDLDRQTREEFNRFQEGCVEENTNTAALVRRLLSDDYADKVIVMHHPEARPRPRRKQQAQQAEEEGKSTYKEQLEPLRDKRIVFIFDECHRSQFGENHKAIKEFFPKAQLFGFTGTPIFEENAHRQADRGRRQATQDHEGPLPEATARIHDHPRHRGPQRPAVPRRLLQAGGQTPPKPGETLAKRAVVEAILAKHDAATGGRRVQRPARHRVDQRRHRVLRPLQDDQTETQAADPDFVPLNIACVFSPPAEGRHRREADPGRPAAGEGGQRARARGEEEGPQGHHRRLQPRYGTNHSIGEFDLYYQDVQKRIKDQQFPNADLPTRAARRSTSPSSSTCSSPASTPST